MNDIFKHGKTMNCLICERIKLIKNQRNSNFVAELETGYVVIGDHQFFRGYSLLLSKVHANELHELPSKVRSLFLQEMGWLAEAVHMAFQPKKINYECLGNAEPHLHWHIFPRYGDDPSPGTSSWKVDKNIRYSPQSVLSPEERDAIKLKLLEALSQVPEVKILSDFRSLDVQ